MRRALFCMAALVLLAVSAQAGRIADSLAFQGRMTTAADVPVTGSQMVILSLWSDSTGGSMLYSEDQTVQFANGLFSVCVGCAGAGLDDAVFSASPQLWLQVQLSGQAAMTPRTLFRSSPRAVSSSRVLGDITTSAGRVAVGDVNGDGYLDLHSASDQSSLHIVKKHIGNPKYSEISFRVMEDGVTDFRDCDSDNDGLSDSRMTSSLGHGGGGGGGGAGGSIILEADLDGDGTFESSTSSSVSASTVLYKATQGKTGKTKDCKMAADDDSAYAAVTMDVESDGIVDNSASSSASSSTVMYKATQGKSGKAKQCKMVADDDSAYTEVSMDLGTDGVLDNSVTTSADLSSAKHAINTKGTGTSGRSISSSTSQTNAIFLMEADVDGDGHADNSIGGDCDDTDSELRVAHEAAHVVQQRAGATTAMCVASGDLDGDGILESSTGGTIEGSSVSYTAKQGKSGKTKRCASTADDTGASSVVAVDLDQDGIDELLIDDDCDDLSAERTIKVNNIGSSGQDGVEVKLRCVADSVNESHTITDGGVTQLRYTARAGKTGSAKRTTCTDPGATTNSQATEIVGLDSVMHELSFASSGGVGQPASLMKAKEKANRTKCSSNLRCTTGSNTVETDLSCDTASARSSWAASSALTSDSLVIQASASGGTDPIVHSSGAHLTAGGVWTNASDVNLKENFKAVDGEEILEKVEELPISQWNYKVESDDVTHIGPTAQDFKEIFGVGGNDKSISTIDPSGIALAAIKELGRQNRELKEENKKMKDLLEDLMKKVEKLSSEK